MFMSLNQSPATSDKSKHVYFCTLVSHSVEERRITRGLGELQESKEATLYAIELHSSLYKDWGPAGKQSQLLQKTINYKWSVT